MPLPRLSTISDFSRLFGVGRTMVYQLVGTGELRAVKVGRRTLIDIESASAWANNLPPAAIHTVRPRRAE
jgi:excisionase family DNA binding protein